jgi:disulfide oxidoreductase YuzD
MEAPQVTLTTSEQYVNSSQALCKACVSMEATNPIYEVLKTVWQRRGINLLFMDSYDVADSVAINHVKMRLLYLVPHFDCSRLKHSPW